jgi:hypothetical protein
MKATVLQHWMPPYGLSIVTFTYASFLICEATQRYIHSKATRLCVQGTSSGPLLCICNTAAAAHCGTAKAYWTADGSPTAAAAVAAGMLFVQ